MLVKTKLTMRFIAPGLFMALALNAQCSYALRGRIKDRLEDQASSLEKVLKGSPYTSDQLLEEIDSQRKLNEYDKSGGLYVQRQNPEFLTKGMVESGILQNQYSRDSGIGDIMMANRDTSQNPRYLPNTYEVKLQDHLSPKYYDSRWCGSGFLIAVKEPMEIGAFGPSPPFAEVLMECDTLKQLRSNDRLHAREYTSFDTRSEFVYPNKEKFISGINEETELGSLYQKNKSRSQAGPLLYKDVRFVPSSMEVVESKEPLKLGMTAPGYVVAHKGIEQHKGGQDIHDNKGPSYDDLVNNNKASSDSGAYPCFTPGTVGCYYALYDAEADVYYKVMDSPDTNADNERAERQALNKLLDGGYTKAKIYNFLKDIRADNQDISTKVVVDVPPEKPTFNEHVNTDRLSESSNENVLQVYEHQKQPIEGNKKVHYATISTTSKGEGYFPKDNENDYQKVTTVKYYDPEQPQE